MFQFKDRDVQLAWTQVLVFASVMLATMSPFTTPVLVGGAFTVQAFWYQRDHGDLWNALRVAPVTGGWIAYAVLVGYLVLRLSPASEFDAVEGVTAMAAYGVFMFGTFALFERQNEDVQRAISRALLTAFVTAAAFSAYEFLSGFALRRLVWRWLPMFRPAPEKVAISAGDVKILVPFIANQASAVMLGLIWPVLMLVTLIKRTKWQRIAIWLALALAALAILKSDQATSKVALAAGFAAWCLTSAAPKLARPTLAVVWLASTLLIVPVALFGYHNGAYQLPMAYSAQHRVVIWGVTAEKTLKHPIVGIGTGRTPVFDETDSPTIKRIPGTQIPIATNRHAHNVFLQTWYENGAIGALLLVLTGLLVIDWIGKAPSRARPLMVAAFVSAVASASFSYSMLASWFIATFAFTALFCRFVMVLADDAAVRAYAGNERHVA